MWALRSILLNFDENIVETKKYGAPCFCYSNRHFCYIWLDKKTIQPYLLWVDGNKLNHPALEKGNRKRMKILRINPEEDLPIKTIHFILKDALLLLKKK